MKKIFMIFGLLMCMPLMAWSETYDLKAYVVDAAGSTHTSSTYYLFDAVAEPITRQSNNSTYKIQSGYFNRFFVSADMITITPTAIETATVTPTVIRQFNGEVTAHERVFAAPNPIRGNEGKIYFDLAMSAEVEIKIYTPHNQLVLSRHWSQLPAGQNLWNWQIGNLANGVYLLRLKATNNEGKTTSVLRKVIVIK